MSGLRLEVSAYFLHEADARRTADALDVMFEQSVTLMSNPMNGRRWLLTVVLPDDPSLGTFNVDTTLLAMVSALVEDNGGALWDDSEDASEAMEYHANHQPNPEVVAEMHRRLVTPESDWVMVDAVEREARSQDKGSEHRQLMQQPPHDRSAHFLHEADARRAADALEAMLQCYRSDTSRPGSQYSRLLTIMLPENPSLATFFVDSYLMFRARELVERHGGSVSPATVDTSEATNRRVTTRDLIEAAEHEMLAQQPGGDVAGVDGHGTDPLVRSER
jgi:hypothetical protein